MTTLSELVGAELSRPVDPRVSALAAAIAAQHGKAARAVLFYGSCLRESQLDGLMLDFYLIVSDYRAAYTKGWMARANAAIPPNVFPFAADGLSAKYAVLSEADFDRLCGPEADNVSVWARFAQPARLVWSSDGEAAARAVASVARAAPTLLALAAPAAPQSDEKPAGAQPPLALWRTGFALTYKAELRAERTDRSGSIVDSDPERYAAFTAPALAAAGIGDRRFSAAERAANARRWRMLQRRGKRVSVLRLAKASLTFAGGIDYLAWKINRHAGTRIVIKPWQRRFPILGALSLLPRLLATGAIR